MASSEEHTRQPVRKSQSDLWLRRTGNFSKSARWFAFSTAAHILVLAIFATSAVTILIQQPALIKGKALPVLDQGLAEIVEDRSEDWEGEPSQRDNRGVLKMIELPLHRASSPLGPLGLQDVQRAALPYIPGPGLEPILINPDRVFDDLAFLVGQIAGYGHGGDGTFEGEKKALKNVGLDVALVIDATDSMQFVIDSVRDRLVHLVSLLHKLVPTSRIGIVAYRDSGEEYVTKWVDLSFSTKKLAGFLRNLNAGGGGDWPEAMHEGLDAAMNDLGWRKRSRRVVILVPGSPPHPESMKNVLSLAQRSQSHGGVVSVIDLAEKMHEDFERKLWARSGKIMNTAFELTPLPGFYRDFQNTMASVAQAGGGDFIPLDEERTLARKIIILTFGSRWQVEMEGYLRELEQEGPQTSPDDLSLHIGGDGMREL